MKIKNYYKANTLEEAYSVLTEDEKNIIIGGGAWLKLTNKEVETCVDITTIGLKEIIEHADTIEIGSMTSLRQIEVSNIVQNECNGILSEAIKHIMGVGIRNIATIGGSIMGKYAFSDILTPLLVMDASLIFYKQGTISLEEFLKTKKRKPDILTKLVIPKSNKKGYFHKVQKTRLDFAVINVAITCNDKYRIAVGARPSISVECINANEFINKQEMINDEIISKTVSLALEELKFGTNSRASEEYRTLLAKAYLKRGLKEVSSYES